MTKLSDIPLGVDRPQPPGVDAASVTAVLTRLTEILSEFVATGRPGVIDLRQLPRMTEATYQALKDALSAGEVSAIVDTESRVEVRETQYPGVWWTTHRDVRGAIVTELIEIARIPAILEPHPSDIQAGLRRLQRTLAESVQMHGLALEGPARPASGPDERTDAD